MNNLLFALKIAGRKIRLTPNKRSNRSIIGKINERRRSPMDKNKIFAEGLLNRYHSKVKIAVTTTHKSQIKYAFSHLLHSNMIL
ncbi:hypothetical protein BCJMU51_p1097 (plasmid) [Bacillus cereus]|nr:hypothetical protein BCM0045_p1042 [Bacillus cereus]BCC03540.1 hypothetical protein BCM0057_p1114 [Bacillus cereus]BCC27179.1 hypothetical protein BCM0079_p1234 [Bacillus cereus]BCC38652.1 hypothetical protein BCM0105_p1147 [Bacillus cereus]BCC44379.1 hypothetical protein BCJMU01_p1076 [Bacillus cereus]